MGGTLVAIGHRNLLVARGSVCHSVDVTSERDDPTGFEAIDYALAAYPVEGEDGEEWELAEVAPDHLVDLHTFLAGLRRMADDVLGLVAVDEEFAVVARVEGHSVRLLLSDITMADEWPLALDVVERLGLPEPEEDDDPAPAGDLHIVADLGVDAVELAQLLDDDLSPDELLSEVAAGLGFGELFDEAVGLETA
jgi:putative tRNA adenosine deaminase-associated protein